jgi:tetratricopeptide (TPR) repeat protein
MQEAVHLLGGGTAELYLLLGDSLYYALRNEEALQAYEKALTLDDSLVRALSGKAKVLNSLGRLEESRAIFNRALALEPSNASILANKAQTLCLLGRCDEAIPLFDRALELQTDSPWILADRAEDYTCLVMLKGAGFARQKHCAGTR